MVKRELISCAIFGLVLLFCTAADPNAHSSTQQSLPDRAVLLSRYLHQGFGGPKDLAAARNWLRHQALVLTTEEMADNRQFAVENGWNEAFIQEIDRAIEWSLEVKSKGPEYAYAQSKRLRDQKSSESAQALSLMLLIAAFTGGNYEAGMDLARIHISDSDPGARSEGRSLLWSIAKLGFVPAQAELGMRYRDGHGYKRNPAKALYWLKRALANGAQVGEVVEHLEANISRPDLRLATGWLHENRVPNP